MIKYAPLLFFYFLSTGSAKNFNAPVAGNWFVKSKAITVAPAQTPVPSAFLVIPGKRIGMSTLNGSATTLYKSLGKPSSEDASMGGKSLITWTSKSVATNEVNIYFNTPHFGTLHAQPKAQVIRVTSPRFMTQQKVGVGAALAQIQKYFKNVKKIASYMSPKTQQEVAIYDDIKSGIAFEINQQQNCVGITVHKVGEDPLVIYQGLFDEVKQ